MKKIAINVLILVLVIFSSCPWAQPLPRDTNPGVATPSSPIGPTIPPGSGFQSFLSLVDKSRPKPSAPTLADGSFEPMFQIKGPDMRSGFWEDRETAGRILLFQGELMKRMGEALIEQGEAMLDESKESAQQN